MKIAIIGAGNVGTALGDGWKAAGHEIRYGVKEPAGDGKMLVGDAVTDSDVVVIAVPWLAVEDVLSAIGPCEGKIVIDAVNAIRPDFSGLVAVEPSVGEFIQSKLPLAKVVKALNTVGFNIMRNPVFAEGRASMAVAGDDKGAKETVLSLVNELGFTGFNAGPLSQSSLLEHFAWLWITLAAKVGYGREIGFQFMQR